MHTDNMLLKASKADMGKELPLYLYFSDILQADNNPFQYKY